MFKYFAIAIDFFFKIYNKLLMYLYLSRFSIRGKNIIFHPVSSYFTFNNIILGSNVFIGPRAYFSSTHGKIIIGDNVMFGPNVVIVGGNHIIGNKEDIMVTFKKSDNHNDGAVIIENNVWIGTNVVIMPNVIIHSGAIVGAGSIVTKNVEPYSIYGGNPAKLIKYR